MFAVLIGFVFQIAIGQRDLVGYIVFFYLGYWLSDGTHYAKVADNVMSRSIIWCGRQSLGIYAVHWNLLFYFSAHRLVRYHEFALFGIPETFVSLMVFLAWIGITVLSIVVMRKFFIVRYVFLGER